ncbi:MAG: DHHA1 domain-containing protein, partial [Verrucomicrobiota bacterium]
AEIDGQTHDIVGVQKIGNATAHVFETIQSSTRLRPAPAGFDALAPRSSGIGRACVPLQRGSMFLSYDGPRRRKIEAHHTATHLLHWALHEIVSPEATQQGSSVSPDRLRFDFNAKALKPEQIAAMEDLVNATIREGAPVSWTEVPYAEVKGRDDIMQFFGDKYGERVRVVQIGGRPGALDGYSMELCGGTHVRDTSEIGRFKIKSEGAIAAGVRRIEAVCGEAADAYLAEEAAREAEARTAALEKLAAANEALAELGADTFEVADDATAGQVKATAVEADKALKKAQAAEASRMASQLLDSAREIDGGLKFLVAKVDAPSPSDLRDMAAQLGGQLGESVVVLGAEFGDKVSVCANVSDAAIRSGHQAGAIIRRLTAELGGKGGGKPGFAMGGAPNEGQLDKVLDSFSL